MRYLIRRSEKKIKGRATAMNIIIILTNFIRDFGAAGFPSRIKKIKPKIRRATKLYGNIVKK